MKYAYMALAGFIVLPCIRNSSVRIYMLDSMRTSKHVHIAHGTMPLSFLKLIFTYNYCTFKIAQTIYNYHLVNLPTPADTVEMTSTLHDE